MNELLSGKEWLATWNVWHWVAVASVLIILELSFGANFFLLWLAIIAAGVAIILSWIPLEWTTQFFLFAIGSITSIFTWYFYLDKRQNKDKKVASVLNQRSSQYIGRQLILTEPLLNGQGKVFIDGILWHLQGPDLDKGATVVVVNTTEIGLKVKAVE